MIFHKCFVPCFIFEIKLKKTKAQITKSFKTVRCECRFENKAWGIRKNEKIEEYLYILRKKEIYLKMKILFWIELGLKKEKVELQQIVQIMIFRKVQFTSKWMFELQGFIKHLVSVGNWFIKINPLLLRLLCNITQELVFFCCCT